MTHHHYKVISLLGIAVLFILFVLSFWINHLWLIQLSQSVTASLIIFYMYLFKIKLWVTRLTAVILVSIILYVNNYGLY